MRPERDANGRWQKGQSGNPTGKSADAIQDAIAVKMLREVVTEEDWRTIWRVGMARAKSGSVKWAKLMAAYDSGKPIETRIIESTQDIEMVWPEDADNATPSA